jgi:hypothetical protein
VSYARKTEFLERPVLLKLPKILVCTRFSFFGSSGWKSEFSSDPSLLFDESRLLQRFWLFENITLPSLANQTDKDFHYYILSSKLMPDWAKERLKSLCEVHLLPGSYTIRFARTGRAKKFQTQMLSKFAGEEPVAQVVLDDDDALACDFIDTLKSRLKGLDNGTLENGLHFITFPLGYILGLRENSTLMWLNTYRFINLGLTLIGSSTQKNIFAIDHISAPKKFGFTSYADKPMYIRTVSNVNDSRVGITSRWVEVENWETEDDIKSRFPFLLEKMMSGYHSQPSSEAATRITYSA